MAGTKGGKGGPKRQAKVRSPHCPSGMHRRFRTNLPAEACCRRRRHCCRCRSSFARLPLHPHLLPISCPSSRRVALKPPTPAAAVAVQPSSSQPRGRRPSSKERSWCVLVSGCGRLRPSTCHRPLLAIELQACESLHKDPGASSTSGRLAALLLPIFDRPRCPQIRRYLLHRVQARRVAALPVAHRLPPSCSCWLRHLCGSRKCGWPYGGRAASWACLQRRWVLRAGGMVGGPPWMQ